MNLLYFILLYFTFPANILSHVFKNAGKKYLFKMVVIQTLIYIIKLLRILGY